MKAGGIVADRFALCQTLDLTRFRQLADGVAAAGYRPTTFRPYLDRDIVRVAAVWTRDRRKWTVDECLSESEMQRQISGPRVKAELLLDLTAYETPTGEMRHTALWSSRRPEDPEAKAYIGPSTDALEPGSHRPHRRRTMELSRSISVHNRLIPIPCRPLVGKQVGRALWSCAVRAFLKPSCRRISSNRTITLVDAASVPFRTLAESRRIVFAGTNCRDAEQRSNEP